MRSTSVWMQWSGGVLGVGFGIALSLGLSGTPAAVAASPAKLTISCGSNGLELEMCKQGVKAFTEKTKIPVSIFSTPNDSNDRLSIYQQLLAAKSSDIDLYQIDVVWPGILAPHFLDLQASYTPVEVGGFLPAALENGKVNGKLVAIPWFTDGGVLYYRKDLLTKYGFAEPATWAELGETGKAVAAKEKAAGKEMWGYVFQGRAYEGLTCNALEWFASFGVPLIDAQGKLGIDNAKGVAALSLFAGWMDSVAPNGALNYSEEEARGAFQSGKAVFMRNWPYAWALLNAPESPVHGKVVMAALPSGTKGGPRASTLGGWALAVSAYSKYPKQATELLKYLTSAEQQKIRAIKGGMNPSLVAVYEDKEVVQTNPHLKELKTVFLSAVARPSRQTQSKYNRFSSDLWNATHNALAKRETPEAALKNLDARVTPYLSKDAAAVSR